MSEISDLPADRQAVLSLLVRQRRTYDAVAAMLKIEPDAVRSRAVDAVSTLGGEAPAGVADGEREQIADYLLGQLSESERIETLALLLDTAAGRAWARRVAAALAPIAGDSLPAVPEDPEGPSAPVETAESFEADEPVEPAEREPRRRREPERRAQRAPERRPQREPERRPQREPAAGPVMNRGLGVVIAAAALIVAAIVVFAVSGGSSSLPTGPIPASAATATTSSTTAATTAGTTGVTGVSNEVAMRPTSAGGNASGAVAVVNSGATPELAFTAQKLSTPPAGDHYVLWLYNSASQFEALGEVASVANGTVSPVAVQLPSNASSYTGVVLTLESSNRPARPGTIILAGTSSSPF